MACRWLLAAVFASQLVAGAGGDPVRIDLETATSLAETNSFELSRLMHGIRAEERRYRLQLRDYLPQLTFSYADSKTVQYFAPDSRSISLSAALEQPVYRGGRTKLSREIQKSGLVLQQQEVENSRQSLHDECFSQFHRHLIEERKIALLEEGRRLAEAQLEIARVELQVGFAREVDFLETELQLKELEQRILAARAGLEEIDYAFRMLVGLEPDQAVEIVGAIDREYEGMILHGSPQSYTDIAMENNLNLAQARFQVAQNRARLELCETTWIPNVSLQASASISGSDYPLQDPGCALDVILEFPYEWLPLTASVSLSSTTGRQYGQAQSGAAPLVKDMGFLVDRDIARLELQAAQEARSKLSRDLEFTVRHTLRAHERGRASLRLLRETVELRERQLKILETEVEIGAAKRVDYVEAQNELLDRKLELLEAILDVILLERSFERLLGFDIGGLAQLEAAPGAQ